MKTIEPTEKKNPETIKYETISFRLCVKEKKYVYDIINRIKEIDETMNNKNAIMFIVSLFDKLILHNEFIKQINGMLIANEVMNAIRNSYNPLDLYGDNCIWLIKIKDKFLCSKDSTFANDKIQFKPADCESCLEKVN